ncbi:MAG: ATP-binding protein [Chlorobi bacterium]|nr:ATP-binding protein [Chlorobiota bacterium]
MKFNRATKDGALLRLTIAGPSGSGKTFSALSIAQAFGVAGEPPSIALIDTEHGSASKYADLFTFDTLRLDPPYSPARYIEAIQCAAKSEYDILIIDSLSHEWSGAGGILEIVDQKSKANRSGNSFSVWADATPLHQSFVTAILSAPLHIIGTLRSKTEYVLEQNLQGKTIPKKMGLAPIQREGFEYEFDVSGEMNLENELVVIKSRCPAVSGQVFAKPGMDLGLTLANWLSGQIGSENGLKLSKFATGLGWSLSAIRAALQERNLPDIAFEALTIDEARKVKVMLLDAALRERLASDSRPIGATGGEDG